MPPLLAIPLLLVITIAVWPDDESSVTAGDATSTTVEPSETTTSVDEPTTTAAPTTTVDETTTTVAPTTEAPATTRPPSTTRAPATSAPATTTATTKPPPPYRSSVETVTADQLGSSYRTDLDCAQPAELRAVDVTHWGYDGGVHQGRLIVHQDEAENVAAIFGDLYAARFPIQRIEPIGRAPYNGDDHTSMRANNTSGYNCRYVANTTTPSNHAFGRGIDVNPLHNPYVKDGTVDPPEGAPWADRSDQRPGMIYGGDAVVTAFGARGWSWGGYWNSPDYQHFDK